LHSKVFVFTSQDQCRRQNSRSFRCSTRPSLFAETLLFLSAGMAALHNLFAEREQSFLGETVQKTWHLVSKQMSDLRKSQSYRFDWVKSSSRSRYHKDIKKQKARRGECRGGCKSCVPVPGAQNFGKVLSSETPVSVVRDVTSSPSLVSANAILSARQDVSRMVCSTSRSTTLRCRTI